MHYSDRYIECGTSVVRIFWLAVAMRGEIFYVEKYVMVLINECLISTHSFYNKNELKQHNNECSFFITHFVNKTKKCPDFCKYCTCTLV